MQSSNTRPFYTSLTLLLFLICLVLPSSHSFAEENGLIEIQLPSKAAGIEMTLYEVAAYQDNQIFRLHKPFQDSGLTELNFQEISETQRLAETLALLAKLSGIEGMTHTVDENGIIQFDHLNAACYLLVQRGKHDLEAQKVLVPIPYQQMNGSFSYDVVANPKYLEANGAVILTIIDKQQNKIPGATFKLQRKVYITDDAVLPDGIQTGKDVNGRFYWEDYEDDFVSNENGQIAVSNLPKGTYRIVTTTVPDGYILDDIFEYFTIESSGKIETVHGSYQPSSGQVPELIVIVYKENESPDSTASTDESSQTGTDNTKNTDEPSQTTTDNPKNTDESLPSSEDDSQDTSHTTEDTPATKGDDNNSNNGSANTRDNLSVIPYLLCMCFAILFVGYYLLMKHFKCNMQAREKNDR